MNINEWANSREIMFEGKCSLAQQAQHSLFSRSINSNNWKCLKLFGSAASFFPIASSAINRHIRESSTNWQLQQSFTYKKYDGKYTKKKNKYYEATGKSLSCNTTHYRFPSYSFVIPLFTCWNHERRGTGRTPQIEFCFFIRTYFWNAQHNRFASNWMHSPQADTFHIIFILCFARQFSFLISSIYIYVFIWSLLSTYFFSLLTLISRKID